MPQKPENVMLNRVKKALETEYGKAIYIEKTNNPFRGGTPDWYMELGPREEMRWVEGKYRPTKAKPGDSFESDLAVNMLSAQQRAWLLRALLNGRQCELLVGFAGVSPRDRTYAVIDLWANKRKNDLDYLPIVDVVGIGSLLLWYKPTIR